MKEYLGRREQDGTARVYVVVNGQFRPLTQQVRHSPAGFEWGYGGSGPADLARSLLYDATGSMENYQRFKWQVVATLPRSEWRLTQAEIEEWARNHRDPEEAQTA